MTREDLKNWNDEIKRQREATMRRTMLANLKSGRNLPGGLPSWRKESN